MSNHQYTYRGSAMHRVPKDSRTGISEQSEARRTMYTPTPNSSLVRPVPPNTQSEYLEIEHVSDRRLMGELSLRMIYVLSDTVIALTRETQSASPLHPEPKESFDQEPRYELNGDGLYVFNSLRSDASPRSAREILSYKRDFPGREPRKVFAYFSRAIHALDAMAQEATDENLVHRTAYGSGTNPRYSLMSDVGWIDLRGPQKQ